jgi:hypothetical protein
VKLNWKNYKWKQKYKCKKCNFCYIRKDRKNDKIRGKSIFNNRVKEWYSIRQLSDQNSKTEKIIKDLIRNELDSNLIYQVDIVFDNVEYVMIDWTWISKDICLIIYYDYVNKKVIRFWFYDWERYEYIKEDLKVLRDEFRYKIAWFVVDWAKQIKKAIEEVYPKSKIQRCLTHIKRQIKNNISNKPQSNCWKDLKRIINFKSFKNEKLFIKKFNLWEKKYADFLSEKSTNWNKSWYTHRKLRASKSHIKNAIPHMFHYLKDVNIKKSNNYLEWYNWVLDGHIFNHRWIRKDRLISFISLWIYNRNL